MRFTNKLVGFVAALALSAAVSSARADHVHAGIFTDVGVPPGVEDPSHANTSAALMIARCTNFIRKVRLNREGHIRTYKHNNAAAFCLGWINASMVFLNMSDSAGAPALGVCLPKGIHSAEVIKIFIDYAKRHDDDMKYNPSFLIYWAMLEKYPCTK
jgi:hypothetical protein